MVADNANEMEVTHHTLRLYLFVVRVIYFKNKNTRKQSLFRMSQAAECLALKLRDQT